MLRAPRSMKIQFFRELRVFRGRLSEEVAANLIFILRGLSSRMGKPFGITLAFVCLMNTHHL